MENEFTLPPPAVQPKSDIESSMAEFSGSETFTSEESGGTDSTGITSISSLDQMSLNAMAKGSSTANSSPKYIAVELKSTKVGIDKAASMRPRTVRSATTGAVPTIKSTSPLPSSPLAGPARPGFIRGKTSDRLISTLSSLKRNISTTSVNSGGVASGASTPKSLVGRVMDRYGVGSRSPSAPASPTLKAMLKSIHRPDLESVNKALEELQLCQADDINDQSKAYVRELTKLSKEMQSNARDCNKLLTQAYVARDQGKHEVCRGLCVEIVQNQDATVRTRVFAYNTLAVVSNGAQATKYLNQSSLLIKSNIHKQPDLRELLPTVQVLREGLKVEEAKGGKTYQM